MQKCINTLQIWNFGSRTENNGNVGTIHANITFKFNMKKNNMNYLLTKPRIVSEINNTFYEFKLNILKVQVNKVNGNKSKQCFNFFNAIK